MKNYILKGSMLSLTTALLLGMSGCGSSSSDDTTNTVSDTTNSAVESISTVGNAVDGYLAYATVCLDLNQDNICQDTTEPTTTTDKDGKYSLEITATQQEDSGFDTAPLLVYGGYDVDTNAPFTGKLTSPFSSDEQTNITPITAMVQAMVEEGTSLTDAQSSVKTLLGLDADTDLFADPIALSQTKPELLSAALELQKSAEVLANANNASVESIYANIAKDLKAGDVDSLDGAVDKIAPDSDVATATKELMQQVRTLAANGVTSTKELGTKVRLMQNEIKTKIIDGDETTVSFDDITSLDSAELEAQNLLDLSGDTTSTDATTLIDAIAALLEENDFSTTAPLSLEDEIALLKASINPDLKAIGTALETQLNLFQTSDTTQIQTDTEVSDIAQAPSNPLVGTWVLPEDNAAFGTLLVIMPNNQYFMTQQVLGDGGQLGGVEVGMYTPTMDGSFANATPIVNTNGEDSAVGVTGTYEDKTPPTLALSTPEDDTVTATKLVPTQEHPEIGTWASFNGELYTFMTLDGNGNYMYVDGNMSDVNSTLNDDSINRTEFGTYTIDSDGFIKVTADPRTDYHISCDEANDPDGVCGTIAGDSNNDSGFDGVTEDTDLTIQYIDNSLVIKFTLEGETQQTVVQKVRVTDLPLNE